MLHQPKAGFPLGGLIPLRAGAFIVQLHCLSFYFSKQLYCLSIHSGYLIGLRPIRHGKVELISKFPH